MPGARHVVRPGYSCRFEQDHTESETIFGLISETARRTPEAPAFLAPGRAGASYARLHRQIIDVVERLNAVGVGRDDAR